MGQLLDAAQKAVNSAIAEGADFADAFCSESKEIETDIENNSINDCHVVRDYGVGVRAFYNGGMGISSAQSLEPESCAECGKRAARLARAAHPDPDFVALPEPGQGREVQQLFDETIAGMPADTVVQWCADAIEEAQAECEDVRLEGGASLIVGTSALASSTGVAIERSGTLANIGVQAIVIRDGDVGIYFEYDAARRMEDFIPRGVAQKATRQAREYLGARSIDTGLMTLVLGPLTVSGMLGSVVGAASAESIQRNRSFLGGKEGEKIGSELLTIRECPFVPAGLGSRPYDGEGVPKVERNLIDKGVLATYLHNSYTANKAGVENTAHASRSSYSGGVGISTSNLQIATGDRTEAELIAEINEGLYIAYAGLRPDSASGDISATVDFGFKIENGERAYPVSTTMIGTTALQMLANIDAVSSDYREEPGIIAPSLRISDIQVAGAG